MLGLAVALSGGRVTTYTYQGGRKILLHDDSTRFVSRASRYCLELADFPLLDSISRHSWSVRSNAGTLQKDLVRARQLAPAYPAYIVADTGSDFFVTDRVFVRFRPSQDVEQFAGLRDLSIVKRLSERDYLFRVDPAADVVALVRALFEDERDAVERVDHDLNISSQSQWVPADPNVSKQWYLGSTSDDELVKPDTLIDCTAAWEVCGYGSPEIVVGVIDSGCDLLERNFGPGKFAGWALFGDDDLCTDKDCPADLAPDIMYPGNTIHGTLAATVIGASADTYGGVGVAPNCSLLPVKWAELSGGRHFSQSSFLTLIEYLRDKVDVVCSSWSTAPDGYWPSPIRKAIRETASEGGAHGNGIVWIWSAGNDNAPIHYKGRVGVPFKVSLNDGVATVTRRVSRFTNSFSRLPNVLCTGAVSSMGRRCHYSNYGTGLGIVAPSGNEHLYKRKVVAGLDLIAPFGDEGMPYGGTSAATALVAGVAALVRSANRDLTAAQVVSLLKRTADKTFDMTPYDSCADPGDPEPDWDISPIDPFSKGDFEDKGYPEGEWSPWFGFGKVNAGAAVREALRIATTTKKVGP